MNLIECIDLLIKYFREQINNENTQLSTELVIKYLNQQRQQINESSMSVPGLDVKCKEADLQKKIEDCRSNNAFSLESLRVTVVAGQNALRSSFLANGGAAIANLVFIGHIATVNPEYVSNFAFSILWFVAGVCAVMIASGTTYLTQFLYSDWKERIWALRIGNGINFISILLAMGSYVCFIKGALVAHDSFLLFGS